MLPPTRTAVSLLLLCLCSGCWAFGFGLECPLASRWLQISGESTTAIGINTAGHFLGALLIGGFTPYLTRRIGRGCVLSGLVLSALGIAAFPWMNGTAGWLALCLIAGVGGALTMMSLETLINLNSPVDRRGRDFAFYACSVGIGFAVGSAVGLHLFADYPNYSFYVGGLVTIAPLPLIHRLPPFPVHPRRSSSKKPFQAPFLSLASSWCQGLLEVGMLALLPLYLIGIGFDDAATGSLLGGVLIGILLCQIPIGWLADRIGRTRVLFGCYVIAALGLAFITSVDKSVGLPICLVAVGACSGAFYPLGLALLGERLPASELPRANAWFLGMNAFGSLVGPLLSGPIMQRFGPQAMFWMSETMVLGILGVALMLRFLPTSVYPAEAGSSEPRSLEGESHRALKAVAVAGASDANNDS